MKFTLVLGIISLFIFYQASSQCTYETNKFGLVYNLGKIDLNLNNQTINLTIEEKNYSLKFKVCGTYKKEEYQFLNDKEVRGVFCNSEDVCEGNGVLKNDGPKYELINTKIPFGGIKVSFPIEKQDGQLGKFDKVVFEYTCGIDKGLKELKSSLNNENTTITISAKSLAACPKIKKSSISAFMKNYNYFFAIIFLAIGTFYCFFGVKLINVVAFVTGFIVSYIVFLVISFLIAGSGVSTGAAWAIVIVGLFLSALCGWISVKCIPVVLCLLGAFCGVVIAFILNALFVARIDAGPNGLLLILLLVVLAVAGGYLGFKFQQQIIIIGTSINGAYLIIKAFGLVIGNLPSEDEFAARFNTNDPGISTGAIIGYIAGFLFLAAVGMYVQCKVHKKDENVLQSNDYYSKA